MNVMYPYMHTERLRHVKTF